jgi:histone H3/H4
MELTRPSITRLARKAGIKSVSEECFEEIRDLIRNKLTSLLKIILIVNSERQTKTLMPDDIYEALKLSGENIAESHDLGTSSVTA